MNRESLRLVLLFVLASAGCREELGSEPVRTARVEGRVHIRNQPVTGGWVEFYPVDGAIGPLRSARLRPDGTFIADGVSVGPNAIKLTNPHFPPSVPRREVYAVFGQNAFIRRTVGAGPETRVDIDLQDEWAEFQRLRAGS